MYEDYFKNIVGGNFKSPEYYAPTYNGYEEVSTLPGYNYSYDGNDNSNEKIAELYPDIYNVVSPMIDKIIDDKNIKSLDKKILDEITLEIYEALEVDDNTKLVNSNINTSKPLDVNQKVVSNNFKQNQPNSMVNSNLVNKPIKPVETKDVISRCRNCKNPLLRDLIKILILNKILNNNQRPVRPFIPIPDYRNVNSEIYKPYKNYSKTYFDTPYPEEN